MSIENRISGVYFEWNEFVCDIVVLENGKCVFN